LSRGQAFAENKENLTLPKPSEICTGSIDMPSSREQRAIRATTIFFWFRFFVKRKERESFGSFLMKKKRISPLA
jgi:hypothetical protein